MIFKGVRGFVEQRAKIISDISGVYGISKVIDFGYNHSFYEMLPTSFQLISIEKNPREVRFKEKFKNLSVVYGKFEEEYQKHLEDNVLVTYFIFDRQGSLFSFKDVETIFAPILSNYRNCHLVIWDRRVGGQKFKHVKFNGN